MLAILSVICLGLVALGHPVRAALPVGEGDSVRIYVDADRTTTLPATRSIELGIRTALSEVGNRLGGRPVEIVSLDHRGNSGRSRRNLERYLADPRALVVYSGQHSPPILAHREWIHRNRVLLLDPWAAAGPITRTHQAENWIFRLSVDDSKAGFVLVDYAFDHRGLRNPALLLEDTGWGHSNAETLGRALLDRGVEAAGVRWFHWSLTEESARILLREIGATGADCIFLVANAPEAETIVRAMASLDLAERLPICSHWGLTGGRFAQSLPASLRARVDLTFLQTSYSFVDRPDDSFGQEVFARASRLEPETLRNPSDLSAPTGFIHAYDLTRILIAAVEAVGLEADMSTNRMRVREALENLKVPVRGLIKTYRSPFRPYDQEHPDAHEALSAEDLTMARYAADGVIHLEAWGK